MVFVPPVSGWAGCSPEPGGAEALRPMEVGRVVGRCTQVCMAEAAYCFFSYRAGGWY
ncbi:hypothetical protein ACQ5TV_06305 [Acetobacter ghanensis]|uniref:hypothetical protein n=1 Tax=Acetobacter ghanensis TaxID=431306 RepID=UPI003D339F8F